MAQPERRVQRLHLRADSESTVRRALPRLEDAFRTATLPDAGARLIVVRRLNLGRLPFAASAQSLSLLLESRFTNTEWCLVHGSDAATDRTQAVWFRDPLEAHEIAALRIAADRPVDDWFWPIAVPALAGAAEANDKLRAIAFSLATRDEAAAALPAWTASLVRAGYGERVIAALRPGDGTTLLRAARVSCPPANRRTASAGVARIDAADASQLRTAGVSPPASRPTSQPAGSGPDAAASGVFASSDDRVQFIERMVSHANSRSSIVSRSSASVKQATATADTGHALRREEVSQTQLVQRTGRSTPTSSATPAKGPSYTRVAAQIADPVDAPSRPSAAPGFQYEPTSGADQPLSDTVDRTEPVRGGDAPLVIPQHARTAWDSAGAPTAAGGLLFLVPVLERLGFREWCERVSAHDLPPSPVLAGQIFHVLLTRLGVSEDDCAWHLATLPGESRAAVAPSTYELVTFAMTRNSTHELIRGTAPSIWLTACRRLLRRRARIGLASLVLRPARFAVTATHVDVVISLAAADVRVRRAGLDIDPGWVPWLSKVVTFHYEDRSWN